MNLNYDPNQPTLLKEWVPVDMGHYMYLSGDVYNHPRKPLIRDGQDAITTRLVAYDPVAKIALTKTGTRYQLCTPHGTGGSRYFHMLEALNLPKDA